MLLLLLIPLSALSVSAVGDGKRDEGGRTGGQRRRGGRTLTRFTGGEAREQQRRRRRSGGRSRKSKIPARKCSGRGYGWRESERGALSTVYRGACARCSPEGRRSDDDDGARSRNGSNGSSGVRTRFDAGRLIRRRGRPACTLSLLARVGCVVRVVRARRFVHTHARTHTRATRRRCARIVERLLHAHAHVVMNGWFGRRRRCRRGWTARGRQPRETYFQDRLKHVHVYFAPVRIVIRVVSTGVTNAFVFYLPVKCARVWTVQGIGSPAVVSRCPVFEGKIDFGTYWKCWKSNKTSHTLIQCDEN